MGAMKPSNEDYERVARWLDGQTVELTGEQRALVDEIAVEAEAVGRALDVRLPPGTLHRVAAGLRPARRETRVLKWRIPQAVAAAAVLAIAVGMLWLGGGETPKPPDIAVDDYVQELVRSPAPALGAEIDALETDLASAHACVVLGEPSDLEVALADLADQVERAFAEDQAAEDEAAWRKLLESM